MKANGEALIDQLLQRHLAKNSQPNIQDQLLAEITTAGQQRAPLQAEVVDPFSQFNAKASNGLGIANEGIGNVVNALLNPEKVALARESANNILTQETSDRNYKALTDNYNAQLNSDKQEAELSLKLMDRAQIASNAEDLQANKDRIWNSSANQSKQMLAREAIATHQQNKRIGTSIDEFILGGGNPSDTNAIRQFMDKNSIPSNRLGYVQDQMGGQVGNITKEGMGTWNRNLTTEIEAGDRDFNARVIAPRKAALAEVERSNNIPAGAMQFLAQGGGITTSADAIRVMQDIVSDKGEGAIDAAQLRDISEGVGHILKKYGGIGFNETILKNAIASSLGPYFDGDIITADLTASIDTQMESFGLGDSPQAGKRRKAIRQYQTMQTELTKLQEDYAKQKGEYQIRSVKEGQRNILDTTYYKPKYDKKGQEINTPVKKSPTRYKDSTMYKWVNKRKFPSGKGTAPQEVAKNMLHPRPPEPETDLFSTSSLLRSLTGQRP